jgi:hypothetical protein
MFVVPAVTAPLSQGDLINDGLQVGLRIGQNPVNLQDPAIEWWTARVIVLSQSCDIVQGKAESVIVATVHNAQALADKGILKGNVIRDQVRRHLVYGWYFLPQVSAPVALPEAIVDLRDVHSIPLAVLQQLVTGGKRIASLTSPYREHLAQHFAVTYMRVALPEPYPTQP